MPQFDKSTLAPNAYDVTLDKWGIINWAKNNRDVIGMWDLIPAARRVLLRDAAVKRWRKYHHSDPIGPWLEYAEFLADDDMV